MRTKTLVLALTLAVIAVAASTTYVLAHPSRSYYGVAASTDDLDEDWWNEMRTYMEQRWNGNVDDQWWQEMREHMEQRWGTIEGESWWNDMRQYMEERWAGQDDGYSRYGGYGGYGGCPGMRW